MIVVSAGNLQPSKVAVIRCDSYDAKVVEKAVARGMDALGDITVLFHPGETILLKPNLLQAAGPEKAVCVHPEVFRSVALYLKRWNVNLTYGDSPATANPNHAAKVSGIAEVAESLDIPLADFKTGLSVSTPDICHIKKFELATGVLDADGVVSISKLKTHTFTTMTGAVKNVFGCIPGLKKAEFHAKFPDPDSFSRMLVELMLTVKPRLHIMDGIVGMEGDGPGSGNPRRMNVLLFSTDPVALDAAAFSITGLSVDKIPVLKHGQQLGLGSWENYKIVGDDISSFIVQDFKHPSTHYRRHNALAVKMFRKLILPYMRIDADRCTRCGQCVAICPMNPKAVFFKQKSLPPSYKGNRCIRCFCCQEVCPEHAIDFMTPILGKILHFLSWN